MKPDYQILLDRRESRSTGRKILIAVASLLVLFGLIPGLALMAILAIHSQRTTGYGRFWNTTGKNMIDETKNELQRSLMQQTN